MLEFIKIVLILSGVALNFLLSYLILIRSARNRINQLFSLVALLFGIWGLCLFLYNYPIVSSSLMWLRGAYISATIMELFIVGFSFIFPKPTNQRFWIPSILYGAFFLIATIYALFFRSDWIRHVTMLGHGQSHVDFGPLYIWWTLGEWVLIFLSVINFICNYRREKGVFKEQLRFLITGFFIFGILVNIPDVILPIFFHNTRYFSVSSLLGLIFTGTISYIILRHRFMDLQRLFRQLTFYVFSILFLGVIYFLIVLLFTLVFFPKLFNPVYMLSGVLVILVAKYLFLPWWRRIERYGRSIFIQGLYDREEVLQQLNDLTTQTINLRELVGKTMEILYTTFHPKFAMALSLLGEKVVVSQVYTPIGKKVISFESQEIDELAAIEEIILLQELPAGALRSVLQRHRIAVAVPLHIGKWRRFILMGEKESGQSYFSYDIGTLHLIQPVVRLVAQHVRQVEEIRLFNRQLKLEVNKATAEVQATNKKLQEADAVKDEFISIASHELKTPTTAIQGFLWLVLQKDKDLSAYSKEKLEKVVRLTNSITMLVNDMLDVSKIDSRQISLHSEFFDLSQQIQEIKGEIDFLAVQKDLEIEVKVKGPLPVWADRQRTRQILSNLLTNAVKYTHIGGKIKITTQKKDSHVQISVADTGIGIRKTDQKRLFRKFGKIEHDAETSQTPGSGLGLYITKNLVELSGGKIWAKSDYRKGSTFTFTLPTIS